MIKNMFANNATLDFISKVTNKSIDEINKIDCVDIINNFIKAKNDFDIEVLDKRVYELTVAMKCKNIVNNWFFETNYNDSLMLTCDVFFHPFTFNLLVSLTLKWISCR